ncbi:hypothetical protein GGD68_006256 [Paraburkholderia fungorum]|uniref:Uncharacterized protein n=1 Tax=Paraburkholderia fungorum TaxID=134537 RepID=A0AAW3V2B4_9BURK|nr:hypothetical protein [Paraburkholderia fungorum]MBB6204521.1 hypothetical protein [Paraburkholderia fungorum]
MIDPSGAVATRAAVDDPPIRQFKEKRVPILARQFPVSRDRRSPRHNATFVFNDPLAGCDIAHSKDPTAVNA